MTEHKCKTCKRAMTDRRCKNPGDGTCPYLPGGFLHGQMKGKVSDCEYYSGGR